MYCFTRKTIVGVNPVRNQLLRVKPIALSVKPFVSLVKQKYYYILMYCFILLLFIQHLLSALYTNKHALMRYLINKYIYIYIYTVISIVDIILLIIEVYYISRSVRISSF